MTQEKTTRIEIDDARNGQAGDNRAYVVSVVILAAILALMVVLVVGSAEAATCRPELNPNCPDPGDPPEPPADPGYHPRPGGFSWSMQPRYPLPNEGGVVTDFSQNSRSLNDPNYVQAKEDPQNGYRVQFDGCASDADSQLDYQHKDTNFTYSWSFPGSVDPPLVLRKCRVGRRYMQEGTYDVTLTIKNAAGTTLGTFEPPVTPKVSVNDKLIVAIGDSYGAGEGNPDKPQTYGTFYVTAGPQWGDKRCHRSSTAGAAQVARDLEYTDPHSSVTFVFLDCSGAGIASGLLDPYGGIEDPGGAPLDPQIEEVDELVGDRQIDALIMSAGGNDAGFGDIIAKCASPIEPMCTDQGSFISERLDKLPERYAALNQRMNELGLNVAKNNVYLTEYPIGTRGTANDGYCGSFKGDPLLSNIRSEEAKFITENMAQPLNQNMREAALAYGWTYVGDIDSQFSKWGEDSHGYCSNDPWMRTMVESNRLQGPESYKNEAWHDIDLWSATKGTLHPNTIGQGVYKTAIKNAISIAPSPGPTFAASEPEYAPGRVVVRVTATDPSGILADSVSANATGGCQVEGITCTTKRLDPQTLEWTIEVTREGLHIFDFRATDADGQESSFVHEVEFLPPAPPTINGPTDNSYDTDGSLTFFGAAEAGSKIDLFEEGKQEPVGSATADGSGAWSTTLSGVAPGTHTYTAKATNISDLTSVASEPVRVNIVAPPTNDAFASAQQISGSGASVSGMTAGATREKGEPDHYTSNPADAGMWQGDHTVWYSWTPLASGPTTIDTCQANIDSILAVYNGSALTSLSRVADNNNDASCGGGWGSKVTFNAQAGTTYRIVVGDAGGGRESTFTLKVSPSPPPDNPPKVTSTVPAANATGVKRNTNLTATFSEKMDPTTLTKSNFKLFKVNTDGSTTQITNVTVTPSTDGLKATLNPFGTSTTLLAKSTKYKAVLTTGAKDVTGNPLDQNPTTSGTQQMAWSFKTGLT